MYISAAHIADVPDAREHPTATVSACFEIVGTSFAVTQTRFQDILSLHSLCTGSQTKSNFQS